MATEKTKLQYRVVNGINPVTKERILRPIIANRKKMYIDQFVEYCLNAGFVRGQFHDMRGTLNGFIEGMKSVGNDAFDLVLADWFRIHGELTGTVDETRTLTSKNELKVNVTVMKELKRSAADFSWTNIDDNSLNPKITKVTYLNGAEDKVIKEGVEIVFTGSNLTYHEGDAVSASYKNAEGAAVVIDMGAPIEFTEGHQKHAYPAALKGLEEGVEIEFAFSTRGGVKDGAEKTTRRTAKLITDKSPKLVSMIGEKSGKANVSKSWEDTMTITLKNASTEGAKVRRTLYDEDGTMVAETYWEMGGCTLEIVSDTEMKFTCRENRTREPFDNWATKYRAETEVKLADGTILKTPLTFEYED